MAKRRIFDEEPHAHFITFSCYHRRKLLDDDRAKRRVLGALNAQLIRLCGRCIGFVVMPDHVHAIVWLSEVGTLGEFIKQWKRTSSVRIRQLFETTLRQYSRNFTKTPIWQAHYYDFNLHSRPKIEEKLAYMHENPVRAGLVSGPCEYRWSSARHYLLGKPVGVKIEWVE
jgi:putative transposase